MIASANLCAAWLSILVGLISGTILGLFFYSEDWLGGYGSWKRRLLRLGHISFFGLAFLNIAFVITATHLKFAEHEIVWTSRLLLVGLVTMPLVCFLSAVKKDFRHLFFIPVVSLLASIGMFVCEVLTR